VQLSFDVGGTFTDLVLLDEAGGRIWFSKSLTTYDDLARAVETGIRDLLEQAAADGRAVSRPVIGATTLVTNALIERKGARTALITTRGFADVLEIGREWRYDLYDPRLEFPEPLVPRDLRLEISERIRADGTEELPLALDEVPGLVERMRRRGVTSVAVCLLHAYANPDHEAELERALGAHDAGLSVSRSSDVVPVIREYERTVTTVANAFVRPLAGTHYGSVEETLRSTAVEQPLLLMQSNGGIIDAASAARFPIRLLESGPAAGALGAAYWGRRLGIDDLLAFDMGGTTAKICLIEDGRPTVAQAFEVARVHRLKRGSGLPISLPVIDLLEIGAGGGSIAYIDELGLLRVGPESAGSEPGPACYARGGAAPTVTDADLVLGYLDPAYFLGGRMQLDSDAAEAAIRDELAGAFDGDAMAAAAGIVRVVEDTMATAMRIHATEKGRDPRRYTLFAFGGAAAVHAARVARLLGVRRLVVPWSAGVLAAAGLHVAPPAVDLVRTLIMRTSEWRADVVDRVYAELAAKAREELGELARDGISWRRSADIRYRGQGFDIEVELPEHPAPEEVAASFVQRYEEIYGSRPTGEPEVISWRLRATAAWREPTISRSSQRPAAADPEPVGSRRAWFEETGRIDVPVYRHLTLPSGFAFRGPAILQQPESTSVLGPDDRGHIDELGHLHVEVGGAGS
jgi:N-methylhydantoinase A